MQKQKCLLCSTEGEGVSQATMLQHLFKEHHRKISMEIEYYYCPNPNCEMVYFGAGRTYFTKDLKTRITLKDYNRETMLCHCIQVSKGEVLDEIEATGTTRILEKIKALHSSKRGGDCLTSNPTGKPCFAEVLRWLQDKGTGLDLEAAKLEAAGDQFKI